MFSDKYQDDDLMQRNLRSIWKNTEKIKIVLSHIDLPPCIEEKLNLKIVERDVI